MKKNFRIVVSVLTIAAMLVTMCGCIGHKAEADTLFSGEIVDLQNDRLVVKNDTETMLFVADKNTKFELNGEKGLCIGDTVGVQYRKDKEYFIADVVTLQEHKADSLVFGGEVTELETHFLMVRSESLTVGFDYDENTKINGNLSEGDGVIITYEGDISERPYAVSIIVAKEQRQETLKSVHGTVSETAKDSVLVSFDSADARRFVLTEDTIINGDATELKVGDEVNVVYTGELGKNPVARTITVTREKKTHYVMDGVLDNVSQNEIIIKTKHKKYSFVVKKETRIQNMKYLCQGHLATITYVGELNHDPEAVSIYCSKEVFGKTSKKATEKKTTAKPTDKPVTTTAAPTVKPTTPPTVRPTTEKPTTESPTTEAPTTEEPTTEEPTTAEPTTEEPTTEEPTDAPEPTAPPKPETVAVNAEGTIDAWDNPCVIKINGGGTVTLDISDATISGGYIPEVGDSVRISYDKDNMKLLDVQLVYRSVDESEVEQEGDV